MGVAAYNPGMRSRLAVIAFGVLAVAACTTGSPDQRGSRTSGPSPTPDEKLPRGAIDCGDASLTYEELARADGQRIALDGVPRAAIACTRKECTDGRACCNSCSGQYSLLLDGYQISLGALPGCAGMDCNVDCEPFGRKTKRAYRFVGNYDHASRTLAVDKYCAR